jgi:hypothetical protein
VCQANRTERVGKNRPVSSEDQDTVKLGVDVTVRRHLYPKWNTYAVHH